MSMMRVELTLILHFIPALTLSYDLITKYNMLKNQELICYLCLHYKYLWGELSSPWTGILYLPALTWSFVLTTRHNIVHYTVQKVWRLLRNRLRTTQITFDLLRNFMQQVKTKTLFKPYIRGQPSVKKSSKKTQEVLCCRLSNKGLFFFLQWGV
jgi:hypothetical protein